jgi:acyl-CoA dehydrogenase
VRASAKRKPGEPLPVAQRLSRVMSELSLLRAEVDSALRDFIAASEEPGREPLTTLAAQLRFNNLKIAASEHAADISRGALDVCGIMGFKNDTPFSVGRHLRDTMSAPLMIANERIHETNARLLLIAKDV